MSSEKLSQSEIKNKIDSLPENIKADLKVQDDKIMTWVKGHYQTGKELSVIQEMLKDSGIRIADYAVVKFGFEHSHCYRLLDMVEIRKNIDETDEAVLISERALRPLKGYDADNQKKIWEKAKAANNGNIPSCTQVEEACKGFPRKGKRTYTVKAGAEYYSRVLGKKVDLSARKFDGLISESKNSANAIRLLKEMLPHCETMRDQKEKLISLILEKVKKELNEILK